MDGGAQIDKKYAGVICPGRHRDINSADRRGACDALIGRYYIQGKHECSIRGNRRVGYILLYPLVRGNLFSQLRYGGAVRGAGAESGDQGSQNRPARYRHFCHGCDCPHLYLFLYHTGCLPVCRLRDAAGGLYLCAVRKTGLFPASLYLSDESGAGADRPRLF